MKDIFMRKTRALTLFLVLLCTMLTGCRTQKIATETAIPLTNTSVTNTNDSTLSRTNNIVRDSIYAKDSVVITVYKDSITYVDRWHTLYKDKLIQSGDTVTKWKYITKTDTIKVPVTVTKTITETTNVIPWYAQWAIYIAIFSMAYFGIRIYNFFRK